MTRVSIYIAASALMTVALFAPVIAHAASLADYADQGVAWAVTAIASAAVGLIGTAVAKVTKAQLDAKAREALQTALENAVGLGIEWIFARAADTEIGERISEAVDRMLPYVEKGAGDALKRFGMDKIESEARNHLIEMARGKLAAELNLTAPDQLVEALLKAGVKQ